MAWTCARCEGRIRKPQAGSIKYAMEWRYIRNRSELICELAKLSLLDDDAVVTHLICDKPDVPGFEIRIRRLLHMPKASDHPLLA